MEKKFFSNINLFQLKRSFIPRKWNYILSRESKKITKIHGKFLCGFIWIKCRCSIYTLWKNKFGKFGKGNLSRSELFYYNPNPCFNSIGRAGRENRASKKNLDNGWNYENLQLNLVETSFLIKYRKMKIISVKKFKYANKIFCMVDSDFLLNLAIFNKYLFSGWLLKSGIKYGGNYILYKNENRLHSHSKAIITFQNYWLKENLCMKCMKNFYVNFLIVQNKTRLAQQVSKIVIFVYLLFKKKNQQNNLKKNWILVELAIQRWIPNVY